MTTTLTVSSTMTQSSALTVITSNCSKLQNHPGLTDFSSFEDDDLWNLTGVGVCYDIPVLAIRWTHDDIDSKAIFLMGHTQDHVSISWWTKCRVARDQHKISTSLWMYMPAFAANFIHTDAINNIWADIELKHINTLLSLGLLIDFVLVSDLKDIFKKCN